MAWCTHFICCIVLFSVPPAAALVILESSMLEMAAVVLVALAEFVVGYVVCYFHSKIRQRTDDADAEANALRLHWDPGVERRGIGDLITRANHIALIVSDVGRSLAFYVEVLGFQQIQRPNFDRHGAWLTVGNIELHLIKGTPNAPKGTDLIVSHVAIETDHPQLVLEKLLAMNVAFRQNVSVPEPGKARNNMAESFENSDGKVTQYFIRDPDGYYWELCNCDVLTKFVLNEENAASQPARSGILSMLSTYAEGCAEKSDLQLPMLFKVGVQITKRVARARRNLSIPWSERISQAFHAIVPAHDVDLEKLARLKKRQKTYCDITQGFSCDHLIRVLLASGNDIPRAVLLLYQIRQDFMVALPPQYFVNDGGKDGNRGKVQQHVLKFFARPVRAFGSRRMFAGAAFHDNDTGPDTRRTVSSDGSEDPFVCSLLTQLQRSTCTTHCSAEIKRRFSSPTVEQGSSKATQLRKLLGLMSSESEDNLPPQPSNDFLEAEYRVARKRSGLGISARNSRSSPDRPNTA